MSKNLEERLIISSAQYNAKPNKEFLESIKRFQDLNDAKVIILPTTGKNIGEQDLHKDLQQYEIMTSKKIINNNLKLQNLQIRSNQINPLTGVQHFARDDRSMIFGSPKQSLMYINNHEKSFPKAITTTGTVTHPNYNKIGRINEIARNDHQFGFIYVEVEDNKHFHFRHVKALKNGKFNDLSGFYTPKTHRKTPYTDALVIGDLHAYELCPTHKKNTFEQISKLKPKNLVLHDVFDGYSINHWNKGHHIATQKSFEDQGLNLESELNLTRKVLNEYAKAEGLKDKAFVVRSNHDERLYRWLDSGEFLEDKGNNRLGALLYGNALDGENPLEAGLRLTGELNDNIVFLKPSDKLTYRGINVNIHGHEKVKGRYASPRSIENAFGKSLSGHVHTARMNRGTGSVGTSTPITLNYQSGGLHNNTQTNGAIYGTGFFQLINTINGRSELK